MFDPPPSPPTHRLFQGAFCGIIVGFSVSVWLAIGSALYPPSEETMGILQSYVGKCGSDNLTLTVAPPQDLEGVSILRHNSGEG